MIRPIDMPEAADALQRFRNRTVYLHLEVAPGGFLRNVAAAVEEAVLRSDGPTYRAALRCREQGWVVMEGLTHMVVAAGEPLQLCTLAEEERITRMIQISEEAFPA